MEKLNVEVGQRWSKDGIPMTIQGRSDDWKDFWSTTRDDGSKWLTPDTWFPGATFLGWAPGYGPTPGGEGKMKHATTLLCGMIECDEDADTGRDLDGYIYCVDHKAKGRWSPGAATPAPATCGRKGMLWSQAARAWSKCPGCSECPTKTTAPAQFKDCTFDTSPAKPVYTGIDLGVDTLAELSRLRTENASLRAEVEALRRPYRRMEPVPPYVPSVDEWDLLPEAGR